MNKSFCSPYQARAADEELVSVLTAISIVSNRLARNIALLAEQSQSEEGGKAYEQDKRYGYDHRRITKMLLPLLTIESLPLISSEEPA